MSDTLKQLTHDQIHPGPNLRLDFTNGDLDALEDSIVGIGQLQAILVRKNEDGYELIAGERRWRAIGNAIAKGRLPATHPIAAVVRTGVTDDVQTAAMVVENLHRAGLTPAEEYRGLLRLANEYSWTVDSIAEVTGIPKATVKARLSWAKLPAERIDELIAVGGATRVTELAALDADAQAKVLKAKSDKLLNTMTAAIEAKGREDRAKKLITGLRRKGHLVFREVDDLLDAKFTAEKALFDKLAKKAKKDGGTLQTRHLWNLDLNELDADKYPVPSLFRVKVDQWNVNVEAYYINVAYKAPERTPQDPATETDLQRAQREQREQHDQAVDDWNAKLVDAKHELIRNGKASELIALVLKDAIEEIEDELACDFDLTDEGDITVLEFAEKNATNLARAGVAFVLTNRWTLPPGFPLKPEYSAVNRLHYDDAGKFIPEDQRAVPEVSGSEPLTEAPETGNDDALTEMQHAINPDDTLPCIGCGGNPTPYLTTDGYAICDGQCLVDYEATLEGDEPSEVIDPYPELSDSEEAAEEATWD